MRRALGKGLAQLLGEQSENQPNELAIEAIVPNPDQPRKYFDPESLEELAESIRNVGILQPITVRPVSEEMYEIIAGERRWRASQLAGLRTIPVVIRSAEKSALLELAIIENVQREDISPLECAQAYKALMSEFELTQEQIAQRVGKSRTAVANMLRLLRLPPEVMDALHEGLITEGHARALLGCESAGDILEVFYRVVDDGLSVRETEKLVRSGSTSSEKSKSTRVKLPIPSNPEAIRLEQSLSERFGSPTYLQRSAKGKGKITVEFSNDEDLQRILDVLDVSL